MVGALLHLMQFWFVVTTVIENLIFQIIYKQQMSGLVLSGEESVGEDGGVHQGVHRVALLLITAP